MRQIVDEEVSSKRGVTGLTIRGSYSLIKWLKRDSLERTLDEMLEEFVIDLDSLYRKHSSPQNFGDYILRNKSRIAARMLRITDKRRKTSKNQSLCSAYDKISPSAQSNIERAIPKISQLIQKYVDELILGTEAHSHCFS